jgi:Fe-S cluster assembly ATPase SufC
MLEIKNLHARIADNGTEIIRGLALTVKAGVRSCCG